jgi:hypothetical protein
MVGQYLSLERLERWKAIATICSLLLVPLLIAVGGWVLQRQLADQSTQAQYVGVALGILRDPPRKDDQGYVQLREWAAGVVDQYAPVKLTAQGRKALIEQRLGAGPIAAEWIDQGLHCGEYLIITGDSAAAEQCEKRARQRAEAEAAAAAQRAPPQREIPAH